MFVRRKLIVNYRSAKEASKHPDSRRGKDRELASSPIQKINSTIKERKTKIFLVAKARMTRAMYYNMFTFIFFLLFLS